MSYVNKVKTEHNGAKNSSAKTGFWGKRAEAKEVTRKLRRKRDKKEIESQRD